GRSCAVVQSWLPLISLAADKAVEVIESLQSWPAIERAGNTLLPIGDIVVLAEESRAIAVLPNDLRNHRAASRNRSGVPWATTTELGDATGSRRMMIATSQQRRARRRTKSRRMETRILKSPRRQLVEIRSWYLATESSPLSEATIINQDNQNVRCTSRRFDHRNLRRRRVFGQLLDLASERRLWRRQDRPSRARWRLRGNRTN